MGDRTGACPVEAGMAAGLAAGMVLYLVVQGEVERQEEASAATDTAENLQSKVNEHKSSGGTLERRCFYPTEIPIPSDEHIYRHCRCCKTSCVILVALRPICLVWLPYLDCGGDGSAPRIVWRPKQDDRSVVNRRAVIVHAMSDTAAVVYPIYRPVRLF